MAESQQIADLAKPELTHTSSLNDTKALPELSRLDIPSVSGPRSTSVSSPTNTIKSGESDFKPWTPIDGDNMVQFPKAPFGMSIKAVRPPRPISKDSFRPMTASSKRLSFASVSSKRTIKYGKGKFSGVELMPQPSEDTEDPLNWPSWRKNLNFYALLYVSAIVGVLKTVYISVNSIVAMTNGQSYTAVVALTAVPLMVSSLTGMASLVVARIWGKRPVYIASVVSIFIGVTWNMYVTESYTQNMAARVFQGLGWGAFDTLVLGSLHDTFYEHELDWRMVILNAVSVATTWGAPLLGGFASSGTSGFVLQFKILSVFLAVGMWLIVFGAPETAFQRIPFSVDSPVQGLAQPKWARSASTLEALMEYISKMKPWSYRVPFVDSNLIFQAPRAMVAPTTLLVLVVGMLPHAALWGLASSLSLLFSVLPFMLPTEQMGTLLTGPFILASAVMIALASPFFTRRFTSTVHLTTISIATAVASIGLLSFGLYIQGCMEMPTGSPADTPSSLWDLDFVGSNLSFPVVSFLLGLLAAGSVALDATARPMIRRSSAFTSANLVVGVRNTVDMSAGLTCLRSMITGGFILGIPNAVWMWEGLKSTSIGLSVTQIFVAAAVGAVWWKWEESVRRLDGRVMGLVDLSALKQQGSFFDTS